MAHQIILVIVVLSELKMCLICRLSFDFGFKRLIKLEQIKELFETLVIIHSLFHITYIDYMTHCLWPIDYGKRFRMWKGFECTATILDNYWLVTSKTCCLDVEKFKVLYSFERLTLGRGPRGNKRKKNERSTSDDADLCVGKFFLSFQVQKVWFESFDILEL